MVNYWGTHRSIGESARLNGTILKKGRNGTYNAGQIARAFGNAKKDDPNHKEDGHRKVRTNKL